MREKVIKNKGKILEIVIFLCAVTILVSRLFYDVVLGDESFYLGMADRILKGSLPFYEMYEPTQSSMFLVVPFLAIYKAIVGSLNGGILFLRFLYFFFCLCIAFFMYKYISKRFTTHYFPKYISIIVIFFAPLSLYCVSYNTLADVLIMCFAVIVWGILYDGKEAKNSSYILAGVAIALAALAYPTLIVVCFLMVGFICMISFFYRTNFKNMIYKIAGFCLGGGIVAFIVVAILVLYVGKDNLIEGIRTILADPLYTIQTKSSLLSTLKYNLIFFFDSMLLKNGYVFLLGGLLILSFFRKKYPKIALSVLAIPIFCFIQVYSDELLQSLRVVQFVGMISIAFPLMFLFVNQNKKLAFKIVFASMVPCWCAYFLVCTSSAGSAVQCSHMFFAELVGFSALLFLIFKENIKKDNIIKIVWSIVFPIFLLVLYATSTYSTAPISQMNIVMQDGIYAGLRTNGTIASKVDFIQSNIKDMEKEGDSVLILPNGYAMYPMMNMRVCTPTTWGLYSYWYPRNEQVFVNYYKRFNCQPDRIIIYYNELVYGMDLWEAWYPIMMKQYYEKDYTLIWTRKSYDGSVLSLYEKK